MIHHNVDLITFACRHPNGTMKHTNGRTRQAAFCPHCRFTYRGPGCIFTPATRSEQKFGKNDSAKPRRDYAPRRKTQETP